MHETAGPARSGVLSRASSWLDHPLAQPWCVLGWAVATAAFVALVAAAGGPSAGDSQESVFVTWALAHGHAACAYPPTDVPMYPEIAPVYVLYSSALVFALRIGHAVAFPGTDQLGAGCANAIEAIRAWAFHAGATTPTLWLGAACWLVLLAGVVAVLRTSRRGKTRWEPLAVLVVACAPGVTMSLWQYFHPQDLAAMGLLLVALACIRTSRWGWAGVAMGLAVGTQQFTLLLALPLLVLAPARQRLRFGAAAAATLAVLAAPLLALTSGRALPSVLVGTGEATVAPSLLALTHLQGSALFSVERITPIAIATLLAGWAVQRLGPRVYEVEPLLALTATALALRLVFQGNFFGYHLMAVSVALIVLDAARGRLRPTLLAWFALVALAWSGGHLDYHPTFLPGPTWFWQLVVAGTALALAAAPFISAVRAGDATSDHDAETMREASSARTRSAP